LLEGRGRAEGYIDGLVDAGHLSTKDTERDYLILSIVQRRREFFAETAERVSSLSECEQ